MRLTDTELPRMGRLTSGWLTTALRVATLTARLIARTEVPALEGVLRLLAEVGRGALGRRAMSVPMLTAALDAVATLVPLAPAAARTTVADELPTSATGVDLDGRSARSCPPVL